MDKEVNHYVGEFLLPKDKSRTPEEFTNEEIISLLSNDDLLYITNQGDIAKTYKELALAELEKEPPHNKNL